MYRVLIIDDDGLDIFMHTKIVKVFEFSNNVTAVKSGRRGLEYLSERISTPEQLPDIIFLDLAMPTMGGLAFLDEMDKLSPTVSAHCRVVVMLAMEDECSIEAILRHKNVLDVVPKPLNGQILKIIDSKVSVLREKMG